VLGALELIHMHKTKPTMRVVQPSIPPREQDLEESWKRSLRGALLFLFPFSFALDFRGDEGGSLVQTLMALFSLFCMLTIFATGRLRPERGVLAIIVYSTFVIGLGIGVAMLNGVPFDRWIRVAFPFVLFVWGIWAGSVAANSQTHFENLYRGVVVAGAVSVMFRYFYSTAVSGIELDEMRYQVLSPAIFSLLAYICAYFSFTNKLRIAPMMVAGAVLISIALSITRSPIFAVSVAVIGVPYLIFRLSFRNPAHSSFSRWRKYSLVTMVISVIGGLVLTFYLRPDFLAEWSQRLFTARVVTRSGEDVNYVTRIAEAKGFWDSVSGSPWTIIAGEGFGNMYQWAYEYTGEVASVSDQMVYAFFAPTWTAGHSPFTYALFFGGLIGATWQIYVFVMPAIRGWRMLRIMRPVNDAGILQLFTFGFLSIFLFFSQSLTSNPFGERLSGQYFGIAIGLLLSVPKILRLRPSKSSNA
jgi:hypothetical protein